jgi:hypothetical protein
MVQTVWARQKKNVWRPHINVTHSTGQSPNLLKRKKEETEPAITCAARTCQKKPAN